jgi:hypothetical protein
MLPDGFAVPRYELPFVSPRLGSVSGVRRAFFCQTLCGQSGIGDTCFSLLCDVQGDMTRSQLPISLRAPITCHQQLAVVGDLVLNVASVLPSALTLMATDRRKWSDIASLVHSIFCFTDRLPCSRTFLRIRMTSVIVRDQEEMQVQMHELDLHE